jgi:hypothetical protein
MSRARDTANLGSTDLATQVELDALDLTPLRQDITILALREGVTENRVANNLPNSFIDHFEDDSALTVTGSCNRFGGFCMSNNGSTSLSGLEFAAHSDYEIAADGAATYECWIKTTSSFDGENGLYGTTNKTNWSGTGSFHWGYDAGNLTFGWAANGATQTFACGTLHDDLWHHVCLVKTGGGSNNSKMYADGVLKGTWTDGNQWGSSTMATGIGSHEPGMSTPFRGLIDDFRFSNVARYTTAFTPTTTKFVDDSNTNLLCLMDDTNLDNSAARGGSKASASPHGDAVRVAGDRREGTYSATGTMIQTANAVSSNKTKVSGVLLYKDVGSVATVLGTDLRIYFTCNGDAGGSTVWTEVLLADMTVVTPVFSTAIKMVKLAEKTCTSGDDIRYKAVWANQSVASNKETQLHGIGLNY